MDDRRMGSFSFGSNKLTGTCKASPQSQISVPDGLIEKLLKATFFRSADVPGGTCYKHI